MSKEKLLSIIVPVYNVETYLKRCVKSVAIRNEKLVEIILVDDGSTDASGHLCDELAKQYNCNVIHKKEWRSFLCKEYWNREGGRRISLFSGFR